MLNRLFPPRRCLMSTRLNRTRYAALACLALLASCSGGDFTLNVRLPKRAEHSETQKIALPDAAAVVITNDVGSTRVEVDPAATQATIEITRVALADSQAAADDLLTKIVVTVTPPSEADNTLRISAPRPAEA